MLQVVHTVSAITNMAAGPSYSVSGLAVAQANLGAPTKIFTLGEAGVSAIGNLQVNTFSRSFPGTPFLGRLGISGALRRALQISPPDIVHTHGLWMMPNVYRPRQSAFVIAPRGMLTAVALGYSPLKKRVFRAAFQDRALAGAALFHATAESEYDDIRDFGLRQPVAIIPNGIAVPDITDLPSRTGKKTVLSLGRIHPKKALDTLIRAWAEIEPAFPDWQLRIVGPSEGKHAAELSGLIGSLGLRAVSIEPPVFGAEKTRLMAGASLFALPSHSENFGMTVAESLAVAVPVISTKGAPWEGLETQGCGWWIDHGPQPMAAALKAAMALSDEQRRGMGMRGRDWMVRDFSWDRMARMSLEAYAWILGRGDRPDFVRAE